MGEAQPVSLGVLALVYALSEGLGSTRSTGRADIGCAGPQAMCECSGDAEAK
ncbi:MAG: hypothetical protein RJA70_4581 [Pseudomonadota bacterium]|jgi:hypothetical protein